MKGKNQRSTIHKANSEAAARLAELEAEVERLRDIENVGVLHIKALGEIERLNAKVADMETTARDAERAVERYHAALERIEHLQTLLHRRGVAIEKAIGWHFRNAGRGVHPQDVCDDVARVLGLSGPGFSDDEKRLRRLLWDKRHAGAAGLNSAAGAGQLVPGKAPMVFMRIIDSGRNVADWGDACAEGVGMP